MDFATLKELLHVQQFLGCTNWLRVYLHAVYVHSAKIVGELQKEGAFFPKEGYGEKDTRFCKAIRAIKLMCKFHINLAVLDEAAAIDGSRPLEQIADSSGIAWGGALTLMSADMHTLKILAMVCQRASSFPAGMASLESRGLCSVRDQEKPEKNYRLFSVSVLDGPC